MNTIPIKTAIQSCSKKGINRYDPGIERKALAKNNNPSYNMENKGYNKRLETPGRIILNNPQVKNGIRKKEKNTLLTNEIIEIIWNE